MAICPKCRSTIGQTEITCSSCGYDFTDEPTELKRTGFAYSSIADTSLIVGGVAASIGCMGAILGGIVALFQQRYLEGLFYAPLSFFLCFAMLVVFIRIQDD